MKLTRHGNCYSRHFLIFWFRLSIWSWQERSFLKSAWFSLIFPSISSLTLKSMMLENTFPAISRSVFCLLLLQYERSPFFGRGRMMPFPHSLGVHSFAQISLQILKNQSLMLSPPSLSSSGEMLSIPGALFLFRILMVLSSSSLVGGSMLIYNSSDVQMRGTGKSHEFPQVHLH